MIRIRCSIAAVFLLLCFLSGCGASAEAIQEPAGTPVDMASEIISSQTDIPSLTSLFPDDDGFAGYLTQVYGIPEDGFSNGVICYTGGVEATEIAVLVFSDEVAAKGAEEALTDYVEERADSFTGYVPEQAALAENGVSVSYGRYAALFICGEPAAAQEAFLSCFEEGWTPAEQAALITSLELAVLPDRGISEELQPDTKPETRSEPLESPAEENVDNAPSSEQPVSEPTESLAAETEDNEPMAEISVSEPSAPELSNSEPAALSPISIPAEITEPFKDEYDKDTVVTAWQSGDPSALSDKNRAVYDKAAAVISQIIADDMTPYQQELAIHDYITAHGQYDPEANSNAPDAAPDPDNDNPYGMLVNGVGICRGYSSTFQLFMDLLGIECITVDGRSSRNEHAWNMVRLDGVWYCVDVTWDDPSGGAPGHRYFNVTSQFLRATNHQWNEADIPETAAVLWAYQG